MKNHKIQKIHARQILDSKGRPEIEVDVFTDSGFMGRGAASTGTSVGKHESVVLRDHNPKFWGGLSVFKVIENIGSEIAPAIIGMDATDYRAIDKKMIEIDGTPFKSRLGGNGIYATSIAIVRAAANCTGMPLYKFIGGKLPSTLMVPSFNMLNGGAYGNLHMAFQEFMVSPCGAKTFSEAVRIGVEIFQLLYKKIQQYQKGKSVWMGNYSGYAAFSEDPFEIMDLLVDTVAEAGYTDKVCFAIDCANSENYEEIEQAYRFRGHLADRNEILQVLSEMTKRYPIIFIEDPLHEDDFEGFAEASQKLDTIVVGDDLLCTNINRIQKAISMRACTGMIYKPNQIGTVSESLDAVALLRENNMLPIPSGRAGGSVSDPTCELGVGIEAPIIKTGAPRSGERVTKINKLLRIEEEVPEIKLQDLSRVLSLHKAK